MMHHKYSRCIKAVPSVSQLSSAMQKSLARITFLIYLAFWQQPPGSLHLCLLQQFSLILVSEFSGLAFLLLCFPGVLSSLGSCV